MDEKQQPGIVSKSTRLEGSIGLIAGAAFLFLCVLSFSANVRCIFEASDTAWLVRTGEYILNQGFVPTTDIFSWSQPGKQWIAYQWLFELMLGCLYKTGGLWLLGLTVCLLSAILYFCLLPLHMITEKVRLPYLFGLLSLVIMPIGFWARPQLISFILISVFILILERFRKNGEARALWCLPPLMVLWANCHSFWFIGLFAVTLYLTDALTRTSDWKNRTALLSILICSAACVLINPYGWQLIGYNLSFLTSTSFEIQELHSSLADLNGNRNPLVFLALAWSAIIFRWKNIPRPGILLALVGTVAGMCMDRFVAVAIFLTWPYMAIALGQIDYTRAGARTPRLRFDSPVGRAAFAGLALMVGVVSFLTKFPVQQDIWLAYDQKNFGATKFLKQHRRLTSSMFADDYIGSRQIMEGLGPVFIDSRFDFYGKTFFMEWRDCLKAKGDWQSYLSKWRISTICIGTRWPLYQQLQKSHKWLVVFDDGLNSVWVSNNAQGKTLLSELELHPQTTRTIKNVSTTAKRIESINPL